MALRAGKAVAVSLLVILLIAGAVLGFLAFANSPQRVGQGWAEAMERKDEAALKKLVLPKDQERVGRFLGGLQMFPDLRTQFVGVEDQKEQKIARIKVQFSQVTVGKFSLNLSGDADLPFVLARDRLIFWRVDLEKSEALIGEAAKKAVWQAIQQNPQLRQLLQMFGIR